MTNILIKPPVNTADSNVTGFTQTIKPDGGSSIILGGLLTNIYSNGDGISKPVVFLLHGFASKKEDMAQVANALAARGIFVVCPDAYNHGARDNDENSLSVLEISANTSCEIDQMITSLESNSDADTDRISIIGFSMGAFAGYHYWANGNSELEALVVFAGSPNWTDMIGRQIIYKTVVNWENENVSDNRVAEIDDRIAKLNPFEILKNEISVNVLFIQQPEDPIVPNMSAEALYDILYEKAPDKIEILIDETGKHSATSKSMEAIFEFICRKLGV